MDVKRFIWKNYVVLVVRIYVSGNIYPFGNWVLTAIVSHRNISVCNIINLIYISAQFFEIHRILKINLSFHI